MLLEELHDDGSGYNTDQYSSLYSHHHIPPPGGGGIASSRHRNRHRARAESAARSCASSFCCGMRGGSSVGGVVGGCRDHASRRGSKYHDGSSAHQCQDCYEMTYCADNANSSQILDHNNEACSMNNGDVKTMLDDQVKDMKKSLLQLKSSFVDRVSMATFSQQLCRQWRDVALVLDRLFFIMSIILIVVSLCVLFPRPKYFASGCAK